MISFIKNVFLPEKIKSYYLFSKTVVGIEINKTVIIATKTRIQGNTSSIETIIEEKIPEETTDDITEADRVSRALQTIISRVGAYDEICTILPSSLVIFKELRLPFISREQIKMVIGFEIEPLLPFALRDAVIDFIITKQIPEEKSSEILVTATQKQHIQNHISLFEKIGVRPDSITVDMIALYGLYREINHYGSIKDGSILINLTAHTTSILFMINAQVKIIRTLPKGIIALTKQIASEQQKTTQEAMDYLLRFGLEESDNLPATEKSISQWWESINFTITSLSAQLLNKQPITKIIFLGSGSLIPGLISFITKKTGISCELFNTTYISNSKALVIKNAHFITPVNIISASATLPTSTTLDYNLAQDEFSKVDNSLLIKQLITLVVLTLTLFATLITHYYVQTRKLNRELISSQQEALNELKANFKALEDETNLDDAIETAKAELEEQQKRWFAFSNQSRTSFLQYLFELSRIDNKTLGFKIDRLTIGDGSIILKAEVKDHDALKILQHELSQSKLFSAVESPETPSFTIRITLSNGNEDIQ